MKINVVDIQVIMQRLQKERDGFQEETEKLHERMEFQQNQVTKMQRDKENLLSELELVKERWEKAHNTHQKLTVSNLYFCCKIYLLEEKFNENSKFGDCWNYAVGTRRRPDRNRDSEGESGESAVLDEQGSGGTGEREQGVRKDAGEVRQVSDRGQDPRSI